MKYYYNFKQLFYICNIFKMSFIPVMESWISASLLQPSLLHDPSEIILICWFAAQETFIIIIINVETFFSEFFGE